MDDFDSSSESKEEELAPKKDRILLNMVEILQSVFGAHFRCLEYRTNPELNKHYTNPKEISMSEMVPKEPLTSEVKYPAGS